VSLIERINRFVGFFVRTFLLFGRVRAWGWLLALFLFNWLILYIFYSYPGGLADGLVRFWIYDVPLPWFTKEMADAFGHYPQQFLLLAVYVGTFKLVAALFIEGPIFGLVSREFYRHVSNRNTENQVNTGWWIKLMLTWLVLNGLMFIAGEVFPDWLQSVVNGPRRQLAFSYGFLPLVYICLFALQFFAVPLAAIRKVNFIQAVLGGLRAFLSNPFTCFFLAAFILVIPTWIGAVNGDPIKIIDRFRPELTYWLLLVGLAVEVLANFFWLGIAARFIHEEEL